MRNRKTNPAEGKAKPFRRYPWAVWFNLATLGPLELVRGRDYVGRTHSMAQQVRSKAHLFDIHNVHIEMAEDYESFTFVIGHGGHNGKNTRTA